MYRLPGGAVTALGLTQLIGWGTSFYLPAVFAKPISADTGWSLTTIFAAFSWNLLIGGLVAKPIGRLIDARGARAVMSAGSIGVATGLIVLATATHWLQLALAWTILGVAARASQYEAAFAAIAVIERERTRRAISLITLWGGLASTVFWPFSHFLGETVGWRWALALYAVLNLAICLPLHSRLPGAPRDTDAEPASGPPAAAAPEPAPAAPGAPGAPAATIDTAERDRALVVFATVLAAYGFVFSALSAHLIVLLEALGAAAALAVSIAAIKGLSQVGARMLELYAQRWLGPIAVGVIALAMLPISLALMVFAGADPFVLVVASLIYGASNGLVTIVRGAVPLALFGHTGFATTLGRIAGPGLIVSALAPLAFASVLESGGARVGVSLLALIALSAFGGMLWLARRPLARSSR